MSATIQIAKTTQTKAAFHHGSTVPNGMAAITMSAASAVKTILFSKSEISLAQSRKGAKENAKQKLSALASFFAPLCENLPRAFSSHRHRSHRRLVVRKNSCCG